MLTIAGAILIHAACVIMVSQKDTDLYLMRMLVLVVGAGLMGVDIGNRLLEYFKKRRESTPPVPPQA
jgi:hypothetical protein